MMQHRFNRLSEQVERALSAWWGVGLYGAACVGWYIAAGWDGVDRWVYMTGAAIVILLIGSGRRDAKATHAKLDALTPGNDLDRVEEQCEDDIEARRQGTSSHNTGGRA